MIILKTMFWIVGLWLGLFLLDEDVSAQTERVAALTEISASNPSMTDKTSGNSPVINLTATNGYEPISFETLAAFPIKVDWLMNATNSTFDTLRTEGEIPALIKAFNGKEVSIQGYIKPLKQDASGVAEFLLMRDHALCCQSKTPQINEWVHVQMAGKSVPYIHDQLMTFQGKMQVGELIGSGNVVSIYRIKDAEVMASAAVR